MFNKKRVFRLWGKNSKFRDHTSCSPDQYNWPIGLLPRIDTLLANLGVSIGQKKKIWRTERTRSLIVLKQLMGSCKEKFGSQNGVSCKPNYLAAQ